MIKMNVFNNLMSLVVLVCFVTTTFAQNEDSKSSNMPKGEWIATNQFGVATLEADNYFKVNATIFEGGIAKEFVLNRIFSLTVGLEQLRIKADFNDNNEQLFIQNNYVNLPVTIRFFQNREDRFAFFGDVGFYGAYLFKSTIENEADNLESKNKGLGFNFGLQLVFGLKYQIDERWSFTFGMKSKSDLFSSYKSSEQEFMVSDFYTFQIGLGIKL